ncbi:MAG: amino acid permease [Parvibaculum sp.]|uniref:APC family permease n=1 Tax=Parvibaculum sp. TaxID=2024848 RepID=UPI0025D3098C|nr:amino acid permease [Parvibaculum sp.]MCE9648327.1 amino acid permease [Parvibaculum sp.]
MESETALAPVTPPVLRRSIGLVPFVLYGVGVTVGAGIYVLIGITAGLAGMAAPLSFLLAALVAAPTAFSFAELSARMPTSAGEAIFVLEAFHNPHLSRLVGLAVVLTGVVSSATVTNGAAGYIEQILSIPVWLTKLTFVGALGLVAAWGVVQSVALTVLLTVAEVGGLLVIVGAGLVDLGGLPPLAPILSPSAISLSAVGIFSGTFVAFFAFIGFEDMVNMAEEVREPRRTIPRAIALTLAVTTLLYLIVVTVAVSVVPPADLSASEAPLALVFERATGESAAIFAGVAVLATINTVLVQIVMAARVLYGMVAVGTMPAVLGRIDPRTQTPVIATLVTVAIILMLSLFLPLGTLARATTFAALSIFTLVNVALIRIKFRDGSETAHFKVPLWVPIAGALLSAAVLLFQIGQLAA